MTAVLSTRPTGDGVELSFGVTDVVERVSLSAEGAVIETSADAALAVALLIAMRTGRRLEVPDPVSASLVRTVPRIQQILSTWATADPTFQGLEAVDLVLKPRSGGGARKAAVASFFSGGIDSFHTLKTGGDDIEALVFVQGFDIRSSDMRLAQRAVDAAREVAQTTGLRLVVVRTDIRSVSERFVRWPAYHGAAMAAVALSLANEFGEIRVPAQTTYSHLDPWGSHPLVDPLWGTEQMSVVVDGCDRRRVEKVAGLADDPLARRHLRVCWHNPHGVYNCGTCEKCLRTMITLEALGVLREFETLPDVVDLDALRRVRLGNTSTWRDACDLLRRTGANRQLLYVLEDRLREPVTVIEQARGAWRSLRANAAGWRQARREW